MSEPVTRQRPPVDLDQFERSIHPSDAAGHYDDPLAELARLVGEHHDPYEDVFAQEAVPAGYHAAEDEGAHQPASHPLSSFAAIEAGLRGGLAAHPSEPAYDEGHAQYAAQDGGLYAYPDEAVAARTSPSRRPIYIMAATIAVGVLGVGAAFALKSHATGPSDIKTIVADAGPTKIQPPAQPASDQNGQDSALLGKGNQTAPTKLVSNTEEPVDVGQAVRDNVARDGAPPATDASSVPVPPSPGQADGSVPAQAAAPATDFAMGMPAPKKVKVVSVRPDGTILSDDQPASAPVASDTQAAAPAMPAVTDMPALAPAAKPVAPKPTAAPKSASRVMPKHAAEQQTADGTDQPAPKPAHKAKPQKVASIEPTDGGATTADAPEAAPKSSGGGFAVQLAAPGSEADARAASAKFAKKFAGALEGRRLGFHKAESNGKSVYRVRVGSLSKEEATSLCEKLKADGGTCFVAKN